MASPPSITGLYCCRCVHTTYRNSTAESLVWQLGPGRVDEGQAVTLAEHVGDAIWGEQGALWTNYQSGEIVPQVVAIPWSAENPPALAQEATWAFSQGAASLGNATAVRVDLDLGRPPIPWSFRTRSSQGALLIPSVLASDNANNLSNLIDPDILKAMQGSAALMLDYMGSWTDELGGRWQWVVPVSRVQAGGHRLWQLAPVVGVRVRPSFACVRSRTRTLQG